MDRFRHVPAEGAIELLHWVYTVWCICEKMYREYNLLKLKLIDISKLGILWFCQIKTSLDFRFSIYKRRFCSNDWSYLTDAAFELWNAFATKSPMIVAAAMPTPAFHHTSGSVVINPKCFKCLRKMDINIHDYNFRKTLRKKNSIGRNHKLRF